VASGTRGGGGGCAPGTKLNDAAFGLKEKELAFGLKAKLVLRGGGGGG
jgi:hypothetical protein